MTDQPDGSERATGVQAAADIAINEPARDASAEEEARAFLREQTEVLRPQLARMGKLHGR